MLVVASVGGCAIVSSISQQRVYLAESYRTESTSFYYPLMTILSLISGDYGAIVSGLKKK